MVLIQARVWGICEAALAPRGLTATSQTVGAAVRRVGSFLAGEDQGEVYNQRKWGLTAAPGGRAGSAGPPWGRMRLSADRRLAASELVWRLTGSRPGGLPTGLLPCPEKSTSPWKWAEACQAPRRFPLEALKPWRHSGSGRNEGRSLNKSGSPTLKENFKGSRKPQFPADCLLLRQ